MSMAPADTEFQYKTIRDVSLIQQLAGLKVDSKPALADISSLDNTPAVILEELAQQAQPDLEDIFAKELEQITDQQQM